MAEPTTAAAGRTGRGTWRAVALTLGAPLIAVLVPYRAARFVAGARAGRSVAVAVLAGLLLVPALLLGLRVVTDAIHPPEPPPVPGLPAPQAQLLAAIADGLLADAAPAWTAVLRAAAVWLGSGAAAGLLVAALMGLALHPLLGGPWRRTLPGALRAGAWTAATAPWAALSITLTTGVIIAAQQPAVATPLWLFAAAGVSVVWTSMSAGLLARGALRAAGLSGRGRAAVAAIAAAALVWPFVWLALQLAGFASAA